MKDLPPRTVFTGRIRKDAALYFLPPETASRKRVGRPRRYGAPAPTPEALRTDESVPWQSLSIAIDGTLHTMRVKVLPNLLWRAAGLRHTLQLVVVAPLGYRLRKGSKMLYTKPAFLICTDPLQALTALLQGYVQRWDIEVNFREEKTLLGVGQAQVRSRHSVEVPALQVASYAMFLLATIRAAQASPNLDSLPSPNGPLRRLLHGCPLHVPSINYGARFGVKPWGCRISPASCPVLPLTRTRRNSFRISHLLYFMQQTESQKAKGQRRA